MIKNKLVLASASPRRAELLQQVGIPYRVVKPRVEEKVTDIIAPEKVVLDLAWRKALDVAARVNEGHILAADTLVVFKNRVIGKPSGGQEALEILSNLSGREHDVYTGLVLFNSGSEEYREGVSRTRVWMKRLAEKQLKQYVATGEPADKAGAYGIQGKGALLVEKIDGCYFNVVGLPLGLLFDLLTQMGLQIWLGGKDGNNG